MAVVVLDKRLLDLVDENVAIEKVATGYVFTEGPLWNQRDRILTFSDVRTGIMHRWSEKDGASIYRNPSGGANGNTYDRDGLLITCEHDGRRLSRTLADGSIETVVDRYEGARLNSPNDVIRTRNGDLIFTDPNYGLRQPDGSFGPQDYPFAGVFRFSPDSGELKLLVDDIDAPNGVVLTQDEKTLYIADTRRHEVRAYDVAADGSLSNGRQFCEVMYGHVEGLPDGMKLDSQGNLYVAANRPEGLSVYAPDGTLLGYIGIGENPTNCAWADEDLKTLYVTAQTSVYRLRTKKAGQPV